MAARIASYSLNHPPKDIPLYHSTYFTLIIEYFEIKFIFSSIVLLSKYHLSFLNRHENKKVIQRLISTQIGVIFHLSRPFRRHYFTPTTNPYTLITQFYTDFGSIQQLAFPQHHHKIMQPCLAWEEGNQSMIGTPLKSSKRMTCITIRLSGNTMRWNPGAGV
eukprot:1079780_1